MIQVWFTADTHWGHGNIIRFCDRPFDDIHEHDEVLIANWNSRIQPGDHVYHLGDFALCAPGYCKSILRRLNGTIHLVEGNHDKTALQVQRGFKENKPFKSIDQLKYITVEKQRIFLCHYAMRTWRGSNRGGWHLFGHSHTRMPTFGKSFDVGVDCWNYYPVSFDQVKEKMDKLEYKPFGGETTPLKKE